MITKIRKLLHYYLNYDEQYRVYYDRSNKWYELNIKNNNIYLDYYLPLTEIKSYKTIELLELKIKNITNSFRLKY